MKESSFFEQSSEKRLERFERAPLTLHNDEGFAGHGLTIMYTCVDPLQCRAYSYAIESITRKQDMYAFFQMGPDNEPGDHGWEVMNRDWDNLKHQQEITDLFPAIHKLAERKFNNWREAGL